MSETCGQPHPNQPDMVCDKGAHPFGAHMHAVSGTVWEGLPVPVVKRKGKRGDVSRVAQVIERIGERGKRTGPPISGPPVQAVAAWERDQGAWLTEAKAALRQVAQSRSRFTTGDVWPLVDAPAEKRAMVQVVRHGLRAGWMIEDGAERVHGEYLTRDGVSFPLNKLVPVYASLLYRSEDQA